jgi:hypothetical protein
LVLGGSVGLSSVGGDKAQALPETARRANVAKAADLRMAGPRRVRSLQGQPVIRDLDFQLGSGRRLLIGAKEDHPARQQDHDDDHDSEDDPIHAQVLEK